MPLQENITRKKKQFEIRLSGSADKRQNVVHQEFTWLIATDARIAGTPDYAILLDLLLQHDL